MDWGNFTSENRNLYLLSDLTTARGCLKTLDLLHASTSEEDDVEIISSEVEKRQPAASPCGEEHVLPGGIGTYSISHISYINNIHQSIKPEGSMYGHQQQQHVQASSTSERINDEHSNCSSYNTGSQGFALWEESVANNKKKGKTGKENLGERSNNNNVIRENLITEAGRGADTTHWRTSGERPTQSSAADYHRNSFPSHSQVSMHKSQSFMEMIKSAKSSSQEEELDDNDNDNDNEELVLKKENSSPLKEEMRVKVDGKSTNQKANTPRSKHSATEQRRRSKINDRFQMLRELIPRNDQKRDKASFLLEVIEYVQFLQEKVHKYEGSNQGSWNNEPVKLMPWRSNHGPPAENLTDHFHFRNNSSNPGLIFPSNEKNFRGNPGSTQHKTEHELTNSTPFKTSDHYPKVVNTEMPFPMSLQPNLFNAIRTSSFIAQNPPKLPTQPQPQLSNNFRPCAGDNAVASEKGKEHGLTVEGGTINISSMYSQGLLNTLTEALQTSGVDLSQARLSVQIEVGKQRIPKPTALTSNFRDQQAPTSSNQEKSRSRVATELDSNLVIKKLKTGKS
ncbi:hypothetical protein ACFE04_008058 [Oxalis oulophora]